MNNKYGLERTLVPLGEYQKSQFLFYDINSSQMYAVDDFNNKSQTIWIWGGIVLVVPVLKQLSNTIFIHGTILRMLSIIVSVIITFLLSKYFRIKAFKNKEIYQIDKFYYQNSDFYSFAKKTNRLVIEGFVFTCIASVICFLLYLQGGDILFFLLFCVMIFLAFTLIELNHLKRGEAIKKLEEEAKNQNTE